MKISPGSVGAFLDYTSWRTFADISRKFMCSAKDPRTVLNYRRIAISGELSWSIMNVHDLSRVDTDELPGSRSYGRVSTRTNEAPISCRAQTIATNQRWQRSGANPNLSDTSSTMLWAGITRIMISVQFPFLLDAVPFFAGSRVSHASRWYR
jgi:hypothetical protein